jgi:hypothetical protein
VASQQRAIAAYTAAHDLHAISTPSALLACLGGNSLREVNVGSITNPMLFYQIDEHDLGKHISTTGFIKTPGLVLPKSTSKRHHNAAQDVQNGESFQQIAILATPRLH